MAIDFTKAALAEATCPPSGKPAKNGRLWVPDQKVPGLGLRIAESGSKAFYLYRRIPGKATPARIKLGNFEDMSIEQARRKAGGLNSTIAAGVDPVKEKAEMRAAAEKTIPTFADLWTAYRTEHLVTKSRPRTLKEFDRIYARYLAKWAHRPIGEITVEDCELLKTRAGASGHHHMANRTLELVSAMFRRSGKKFGLPKKWTPTTDVEPYAEKARDRVMSPEELAKVLAAIEADVNLTARDYFKMLIYTGVRKSNVAAMLWQNVSEQQGMWKIPGETTKNGDALVVTLVPEALAVLAARAESNPADSPYVFPANRPTSEQVDRAKALRAQDEPTRSIAATLGLSQSTIMRIIDPAYVAKPHAPFGGAGKAWARILKRAGIASRTTIHDVRRTFCTNLIEAGMPLPMVSAAMGHKSMATTQRHYTFARQDKVADAVRAGVAAMLREATAAGSRPLRHHG